MIRSSVFRLALLGFVGVLAGCTPECRVVQHASASGSVDTVTVAADGNDCEIHMYQTAAMDSVGPKPK
jgi:hypothetical protein